MNISECVIFCDMDQVLSDFYTGAKLVLGKDFHHYDKDEMSIVERNVILGKHETFWETLPPMQDFDKLWNFIKSFNTHILTAVPTWEDEYAEIGKRKWCDKYLGIPQDRVHVVRREEKCLFATSKSLLIDDLHRNILEFRSAGGHTIHHESADETILQLMKLGYT